MNTLIFSCFELYTFFLEIAKLVVNLLAGRVAYCLIPSKPKIPVAGTSLQV